MNKYLAILLLFSTISCVNPVLDYHGRLVHIIKVPSSAVTQLVRYDSFPFPKDIIRPHDLLIIENYLLIVDFKGDTVLHFSDLANLDNGFSAVKRGPGPEELTSISHIHSKDGLLTATNNFSIIQYDLDSLKIGTFAKRTFDKWKTSDFGRLSYPIMDTENLYALNNSNMVFKYDLASDSIFTLPYRPELMLDLPEFERSPMSTRLMSKIGTKLVIAYKWAPLIDVFDIDSGTTKSYVFPDSQNLIYTQNDKGYNFKPGSTYHYAVHFKQTEHYSYLLYDSSVFTPKAGYVPAGNAIFVFDKKGELIKKYQIPFPIAYFTVDNDDQYLYGHNLSVDESHFFRFAL